MKFLLCASLVICFSVGAIEHKLPPHITYSCDDDIDVSVSSALNTWNYACDNYFTIERVKTDAVITITEVDFIANNILGITLQFGAKSKITLVRGNSIPLAVATHELGHALGLSHSTDTNSIMYPYLNGSPDINQTDVDAIREVYGLSPKIFNIDIQVKGRKVKASNVYGVGLYFFNTGFEKVSQKVVHPFPIGVYSCDFYYMHIKMHKEFTIKGKK